MITKLGKAKLEEQIAQLKAELVRTYDERSKAAAEGDLKENSAYIFMGERAQVLNSQISEAVDDLSNATIISAPKHSDYIEFGHEVSVQFNDDNQKLTVVIVGKNDSRIKPNWISINSPLGATLLGKKKNDKITVNDRPLTILDISISDI